MKKIIWLMGLMAIFQLHAEQVGLFTDTEMNGWSKAYTTDAITNIVLTAKASGGNPDAFGEWKVLRSAGGGAGAAKVKESEVAAFRLDLQEFYSTYNVASIDSITVSIDARYGIGNANLGMRKYTTNGTFVAEGFVAETIEKGNSTWATKSVTFSADSSAFSVNGSEMTFENEAYYYTFTLVFISNSTAETLIGQFDNFSVSISYTPISAIAPEASFLNIEAVSANKVKLTVEAIGDLSAYALIACSNLTDASWSTVPHSDNGVNGFLTTNLSYSTSESSNVIIYVESADNIKFYGLQY